MSTPDVPGFGEGLENQVPLEEAPDESSDEGGEHDPPVDDPDTSDHDERDERDEREPSEAEVLHDDPPADEADDVDEGGASKDPAGPPA